MDVSKSDSRREVELANKLIRDREADHSREIENLRENQREQIRALNDTQAENTRRIRTDNEENLLKTRERFDKSYREASDTFERAMADQRHEAYDRYGRLAADTNRERNRTGELNAKNLRKLEEAHAHDLELEKVQRSKELEDIRQKFNEDKDNIQKTLGKQLDSKNQSTNEALAKQSELFNIYKDDVLRRAIDDNLKARRAGAENYHKIVEDSMIERERMSRDNALREQTLRDQKALAQKTATLQAKKSLDEFRARATDDLEKTVREDGERYSQLQNDTSERLAKDQQKHQSEKAMLDNQFRNREADLSFQNQVERDRNSLEKQLAERRHRLDTALGMDANSKNNALNIEEMKNRYANNLRDSEEQNRHRYANFQAEAQKKMLEADMANAASNSETERLKQAELSKIQMASRHEKDTLLREFNARQNQADETHARQFDEARRAVAEDLKFVRNRASHDIQDANREKQARVYEAQQELRTRTDELEMQRHNDLDLRDKTYMQRVKRLTDNYNRSLNANKEAFDDETSDFKYASMMTLNRVRGDAEHEKRIQLMDLLNKNRAMLQASESKFNEAKDEHETELAKMRADNDKALRDTMRRARETLDTERRIHEHELAAKDQVMKEKLKMQEDAFKESIEKLKRSHDLSTKKS